jgi:hypothetical protein
MTASCLYMRWMMETDISFTQRGIHQYTPKVYIGCKAS